MSRRLSLLVLACLVASASGFAPVPIYKARLLKPAERQLVGRWSVKFANGVVEACEVRKDGTASVVEPNRSSTGKVKPNNGSLVIPFEDDRVERWSITARGIMVEHWFPASAYPAGTRVLGIATRLP